MKEKLTEKYLPKYYRNYLLDQLHNLRQDQIFVQNYIATFEDLTRCSDVREHRSQSSQMTARFVSCLRSKIKRAMITGSYDLDTVESLLMLP